MLIKVLAPPFLKEEGKQSITLSSPHQRLTTPLVCHVPSMQGTHKCMSLQWGRADLDSGEPKWNLSVEAPLDCELWSSVPTIPQGLAPSEC